MKNLRTGFSLVELLIILSFIFIAMAALMPMISRKHLEPPEKANHGLYACYRDEDGNLRQTLIKGKKMVEDDVLVAKCQFDTPAKAKYLYVQIVGGGGGGADSSADPLVDTNMLIQPNTTNSTSGYLATGNYSSSSTSTHSSSLDWSMINEEDFNQLLPINLSVNATGQVGYNCSSGSAYRGAVCAKGMKASGIFKCSINDLSSPYEDEDSEIAFICTKGSDDKYSCSYTITEKGTCLDGWSESEIETDVTCYNYNVGSARTFYMSLPLEYGLTISGTRLGNRSSSYTYNGKSYTKASDGYGLQLTWNGSNANTMSVYGGDGAVVSLTRDKFYDGDNSKRCLTDEAYNTIHAVEDAYCYNSSGKSCLTSAPSDSYSFEDIYISQTTYNQTQKLVYGYGGHAGTLKTMILRKLDDDIVMLPGNGGDIGQNGEQTIFSTFTAAGGDGLTTVGYKDIELSPSHPTQTEDTLEITSRQGKSTAYQAFLNLVLSYKQKDFRNKIKTFGKGGNGIAVQTDCTYGYNYTPLKLTGTGLSKTVPAGDYNIQLSDIQDYVCNGHSWYSYTSSKGFWLGSITVVEEAEKGSSGAIIISW